MCCAKAASWSRAAASWRSGSRPRDTASRRSPGLKIRWTPVPNGLEAHYSGLIPSPALDPDAARRRKALGEFFAAGGFPHRRPRGLALFRSRPPRTGGIPPLPGGDRPAVDPEFGICRAGWGGSGSGCCSRKGVVSTAARRGGPANPVSRRGPCPAAWGRGGRVRQRSRRALASRRRRDRCRRGNDSGGDLDDLGRHPLERLNAALFDCGFRVRVGAGRRARTDPPLLAAAGYGRFRRGRGCCTRGRSSNSGREAGPP